jgi:hypothetical protein
MPLDPLVRRWPYPYSAGVSVSNDAEFLNAEVLDTLLKYINTTENTSLGQGLGLSLSSSLFFFGLGESCSIFSGIDINSRETEWATRAKELIEAKLIDTNHAFGDFDSSSSFVRGHAERAYNWLNKFNLKLPVYSNHGGTNNRQNVGKDATYHEGDVASSPAYHVDLFGANGVEFVWTDSMSYESFPVTHPIVPSVAPLTAQSVAPGLLAQTRRWIGEIASGRRAKLEEQNASPVPQMPSVRIITTLQDGRSIEGLRRLRATGANAPNVSSFFNQVRNLLTASLYEDNGAAIIYQHFGVLYRENGHCVPTTLPALKENVAGFLSAWRLLAREVHEGRLWMPRLATFLAYVRAVESVTLQSSPDGQISIETKHPGVSKEDLDGLTLYAKTTAPTVVHFKGETLAIQRNGPDETGQYSVTIQSKRLGLR